MDSDACTLRVHNVLDSVVREELYDVDRHRIAILMMGHGQMLLVLQVSLPRGFSTTRRRLGMSVVC